MEQNVAEQVNSVVNNSVEVMGETFGSVSVKIGEIVSSLSEKLGVASEFILTAYIKQAFAFGIALVVISVILILLVSFMLSKFSTVWSYIDKEFSSDAEELTKYFYIISIVIMSIVALITLPNGLIRVISPEYYGISNLITDISQLF